jgi:thiamine pyrophosphokinase
VPRRALVLAGGDAVDASTIEDVGPVDLVVAADSGLHHAAPLGVRVDRVVGDFDSATPECVDAAVAAGAVLERHPAVKDATDLELAIDVAVRDGATHVVVVGGGGGRIDHFLANVLLLAAPAYAGLEMDARFGPGRATVVRGGRGAREVRGAPRSLVTLLPVGGPARGIVSEGLAWALRSDTLTPGTSRGVSNVLTGDRATVRLDDGTLLVIQPDPATPDPGGATP